MFEIKKDIPVPAPKGGIARKYPFDQLEVGDMFEVPLNGEDRELVRNRVVQSVRYFRQTRSLKQQHVPRLTTRLLEDSVAVWRVA